ncbi:UNVERIFIED_CONTAM: hypothetical protein FKN15_003064 [Acipenser sinensis]
MTSPPTRTDEQRLGAIPRIFPEGKSVQKTLDELQRKATVRQELEKKGLMQDVVELWRREYATWEETAAGAAARPAHATCTQQDIGGQKVGHFETQGDQNNAAYTGSGDTGKPAAEMLHLIKELSLEELSTVLPIIKAQPVSHETVSECMTVLGKRLDRLRYEHRSDSGRGEDCYNVQPAMAQAPSPHSPDQAVAQKETVQAQTDKAQGQKELKIGGFDGKASWEAYRTKFELVAEINGWDTKRKADRLIAALEGEALHTLLEVSKPERRSYEAVVQALDCRFDGTENPLTLRQQLKDRFRRPGEPLGQFAADVRYLARQAYPEFPTAIQEELATDAFLHGLTPGAVRNQVRLDTPQTLDAALARAKLAEVVLGEQSPLPSAAKHPPRASTRRIQSTPMRSMELEPPPDARNDPSLPGKPETRICWRCGQRGHLRHNCGTLSPTSPSLQPGNDMGPM